MKKKKKVQNKNLQNYSKIFTPYNIRLTQVGVAGGCFLAGCLSSTQKWPVVGMQLFWLVDWTLDVYVYIWSLNKTNQSA